MLRPRIYTNALLYRVNADAYDSEYAKTLKCADIAVLSFRSPDPLDTAFLTPSKLQNPHQTL
jgi:hypothetical protein